MRIGFVLPDRADGGAERIIIVVAGWMAAHGHAVHILTIGNGAGLSPSLWPGVTHVPLRANATRNAIRPLLAAVSKYRIDTVCSTLKHISTMVEVARMLRGGFKHIIRAANTYGEELRRHGPLKRILLRSSLSWSHRRASGVICVSEGVANDLATLCPKIRQSTVIANPVYDPSILRLSAEPCTIDEESTEKRDIVAVGRLVEQKGFDILMQAMSLLPGNTPTHLHILGDGPLRNDLLRRRAELGLEDRVHLHGFVANPFPFLARASLFVLSSRFEGLPNVLIQALCLGTRTVATDCRSGPREIIGTSGDGTLVPVDNAEALAGAIAAALHSALPPVDPTRYRLAYGIDERCRDYERFFLSCPP